MVRFKIQVNPSNAEATFVQKRKDVLLVFIV